MCTCECCLPCRCIDALLRGSVVECSVLTAPVLCACSDDGPWPDMSIVLSALAVNCLWTYTLNIFLAYRARGHDERQQHKKYLAQQLKQKADTARRKAGLRAKRHHVSDLESGAPAAHTESEPEQPSQLAGLSRRLPRKPSKSRQRHYSLAPGVQRRHPEDGLGLGAEVDQPIKDVVDEILHLEDESVMENRKEVRLLDGIAGIVLSAKRSCPLRLLCT